MNMLMTSSHVVPSRRYESFFRFHQRVALTALRKFSYDAIHNLSFRRYESFFRFQESAPSRRYESSYPLSKNWCPLGATEVFSDFEQSVSSRRYESFFRLNLAPIGCKIGCVGCANALLAKDRVPSPRLGSEPSKQTTPWGREGVPRHL